MSIMNYLAMAKYVLLSQDGGMVIQLDMESNHLFLCAKLKSAILSQQKLDHHHHPLSCPFAITVAALGLLGYLKATGGSVFYYRICFGFPM